MEFSDIVGKIIDSVEQAEDNERVIFHFSDGSAAESVHLQDCCEQVFIYRVIGKVDDILHSVVLEATEVSESDTPYPDCDSSSDYSHTWTRQRIRTAKGEVTYEWLGSSNGYYGEVPYFQLTHGKLI